MTISFFFPLSNEKIKLFFYQVSLKFCTSLKNNNSNNTQVFFQFLREDFQVYLFNLVLTELLFLVLELKKANSNPLFFFKTDFLLKILIVNSENQLSSDFPLKLLPLNYSSSDSFWLIKLLEVEELTSISLLLNYILFNKIKLSDKFTRILIENLVLKVTETLVRLLLIQNLLDSAFLKNYPERNFLSLNFIIQLRNDLYWSSYFNLLFQYPKYIHNNIHPILLLVNKKICVKNIYLLKSSESNDLTRLQSFILFYFEITDFIRLKVKLLSSRFKKD